MGSWQWGNTHREAQAGLCYACRVIHALEKFLAISLVLTACTCGTKTPAPVEPIAPAAPASSTLVPVEPSTPIVLPKTPAASATPTTALTPTKIPGVANFAKVSDDLYRGAQPTRDGFLELKELGIRTVVNLRSLHSDTRMLKGSGLRYIEIPTLAWEPNDEVVAEFLKVLQNKENLPVFVHCQHGADRTGFAVASYRIVVQGWKSEDAKSELYRFDFHTVWGMIPKYIDGLDANAMRAKVSRAKERSGQVQ